MLGDRVIAGTYQRFYLGHEHAAAIIEERGDILAYITTIGVATRCTVNVMILRRSKGHTLSRTPSLYGTITQRVLNIPELLELIFSFLEVSDNARNARVCKSWTEVALDLLWREVDHLPRLLRILAPIEECDEEDRFARSLEPGDWANFMRYASRVRKLVVSSDIEEHLRGPNVFQEIAQSRTTLHLLPKLSSLTWASGERLRLSLMFMHENIKEFAVGLSPTPKYSLKVYCEEIALRMPRLTKLDLRFSCSVREFEADLCTLLGALPKLQSVTMPRYTLTTKIIEALSRKEHLGIASFEYDYKQGVGDPTDVLDWSPSLEEGAFPALYDLNVSAQLPHFLRVLAAPFFPANLRLLYVHATHAVGPPLVHAFLAAVAESCQLLTELALVCGGDAQPLRFRARPAAEERISMDTLRPVLKCPQLVLFELSCETPLALTQADVEELAAGWPTLEVLVLAPYPIPLPLPQESEGGALTLAALVPFARHCPNLRTLALHLSVGGPHAHIPALGTAVRPFRKLTRLDVGTSPLASPEAVKGVGRVLSELCPADCELVCGVTWPWPAGWQSEFGGDAFVADSPEDVEVLGTLLEEMQAGFARWEEVAKTLPLLVQVRAEERAMRAVLEREVHDLRMRRVEEVEERLDRDRVCTGVAAAGSWESLQGARSGWKLDGTGALVIGYGYHDIVHRAWSAKLPLFRMAFRSSVPLAIAGMLNTLRGEDHGKKPVSLPTTASPATWGPNLPLRNGDIMISTLVLRDGGARLEVTVNPGTQAKLQHGRPDAAISGLRVALVKQPHPLSKTTAWTLGDDLSSSRGEETLWS
ncbi:hypothetical protein C8Q80DRAFT_1347940 [Daedaleopsis nitida]|nr:hypothetical protein C8Q80DRAFT_1347940 [Daedaleopsis nitida]